MKTLGWGVVSFVEGWLLQPDGDEAGEPYRLTAEQLNFVLWFYAVDKRGKFVYRRAVLRRAEGWGKSPFLGALCLAELCGPVRFSHWEATEGNLDPRLDYEPVGKPHPAPWIVIAGVSETQTENTMSAIRAMVEESDLVAELGLDIGKTRIFTSAGGKLMPITSSSSSSKWSPLNTRTTEGPSPGEAGLHHLCQSSRALTLIRIAARTSFRSLSRTTTSSL